MSIVIRNGPQIFFGNFHLQEEWKTSSNAKKVQKNLKVIATVFKDKKIVLSGVYPQEDNETCADVLEKVGGMKKIDTNTNESSEGRQVFGLFAASWDSEVLHNDNHSSVVQFKI